MIGGTTSTGKVGPLNTKWYHYFEGPGQVSAASHPPKASPGKETQQHPITANMLRSMSLHTHYLTVLLALSITAGGL
jgi:hypothetical protein